ncbi:unnamed protein product [Mytilus coruscus]|uniref:Uncharacterized protein n=1 Tax=Mytilus coruscus TaxID=42192 RepID=A0A6J8ERB5_MYTCO|nr:unnamed protein product [Mytilus coruscus]
MMANYGLKVLENAIDDSIQDANCKKILSKGFAVVIINVLLKQSYIAITSRTEFAICQPFSNAEDILRSAPALPGYQHKTLATTKDSPKKSIITVKITKTQISNDMRQAPCMSQSGEASTVIKNSVDNWIKQKKRRRLLRVSKTNSNTTSTGDKITVQDFSCQTDVVPVHESLS